MSTCAECIHAELQCPPVIRCKINGTFRYLDSSACEKLETVDEEKEEKKK